MHLRHLGHNYIFIVLNNTYLLVAEQKKFVSTYIFGLEGSILDSVVYTLMYDELLKELAAEHGFSPAEIEKAISKLRQPGKKKVDAFELCAKLKSEALYFRMLEKYAGHIYSIKIPSMPSHFKRIKSQGKRLAVTSGSHPRTIEIFLNRFNLSQYIDFFDAGNKSLIGYWLAIAKRHNLDPKTTLVIDDDVSCRAAKEVGFLTLELDDIRDLEKIYD